MARVDRLRQRMLAQAVAENLATIRGFGRHRPSRWLGFALNSSKLFFFIAVPVILAGILYNFSSTARGGTAAGLAASPIASLSQPVSPDAAGPTVPLVIPEGRTFPAPAPIHRTVLPLSVRKIILDPGHGGSSTGTTGPRGLVEKEITIDIAQRLRVLLQKKSYEVVMTRDGDATLSLKERADFANQARGDIFLSIHVNWIETRRTRGVETYFLGPTDDPYLTQLAAQENEDTGYSLADFRSLLEGIYADVRQDESRSLADAVQGSLFHSLRKMNPQIEDRGIKTAPFGVLVRTEMPAILAEVSCLSNREEADLLLEPSYRDYIAEALLAGIIDYSAGLSETYQREG